MNKKIQNFERIIFILGLVGILITLHLYIMDSRGFDRGCLGFTTSETIEEAFDCESVLDSEGGNVFGVSNVYLGMAFYFLFTILQLTILYTPRDVRKCLMLFRTIMLVFGLGYSGFLVYYQKIVLQEYCALCLMSAITVLLLNITNFLYIRKFSLVHDYSISISKQHIFIPLLILFVVGSSDIIYFNSLDRKAAVEKEKAQSPAPVAHTPDHGSPAPPKKKKTGNDQPGHEGHDHGDKEETKKNKDQPGHEGHDHGDEEEGCNFSSKKKPVSNYMSLISEWDIQAGNPGADKVIIEFFDPNCGYCKRLEPVMEEAKRKFGDDVLFYFKPFPLWSYSIPQIQALYIAAESGLFFEMLSRQFAMQRPKKGMSVNELKEVAWELGMDGNMLADRIRNDDYRDFIMKEHRKLRASGIKSAPTLMINGKIISSKSRNLECIGELLGEY